MLFRSSGFLKKFSKLLQKRKNTEQTIIDVLRDVVGVEVKKNSIKIKGSSVRTNLAGGQKGQIFIKKQQIIEEINSRLGDKVVTEIQ